MRFLSGYMETTQGVDEIINALETYNLDGYRSCSYIDAGPTNNHRWQPELVTYFLDHSNKILINDVNHYYPPASSADWTAVQQRLFQVATGPNGTNAWLNNSRVWLELINEYTASDFAARIQAVIDALTSYGIYNNLIANKWNDPPQSWEQMQQLTKPGAVIFSTGYHFYFNYWQPSGAITQMQQAIGRGLNIINTEVGASTSDSGLTQALVNELQEFLDTSEALGASNCLWMNTRIKNLQRYKDLGLSWFQGAPTPTPAPPEPLPQVTLKKVLWCRYTDLSPTFFSRIVQGRFNQLVLLAGRIGASNELRLAVQKSDFDNFKAQVLAVVPNMEFVADIYSTGSEACDQSTPEKRAVIINNILAYLNDWAGAWDAVFDDTELYVGTGEDHQHYFTECALAVEPLMPYYPFVGPNQMQYNGAARACCGLYSSYGYDTTFPEDVWKQYWDLAAAAADNTTYYPAKTAYQVKFYFNNGEFPQQVPWLVEKLRTASPRLEGIGVWWYPGSTQADWDAWNDFIATFEGSECAVPNDCVNLYGEAGEGYHWECQNWNCIKVKDSTPAPACPLVVMQLPQKGLDFARARIRPLLPFWTVKNYYKLGYFILNNGPKE